jgi:hypothetical protein
MSLAKLLRPSTYKSGSDDLRRTAMPARKSLLFNKMTVPVSSFCAADRQAPHRGRGAEQAAKKDFTES